MAEGGSRKVVVEVCNARNLMPKDGQGTASAYAVVDFDGQRRRTKTKLRDLNPQWDERMEFLVNDPAAMASETLEVNLYNDKKVGRRSTFLGKVRISGSSFAAAGAEGLVYYPLEKRSMFSQIKGEVGLKVYFVEEEPSPVVGGDGGGDHGEVKEKEKEIKEKAVEGSDEKSNKDDGAKAGESKTEDAEKKSPPEPADSSSPGDTKPTEPQPTPAVTELSPPAVTAEEMKKKTTGNTTVVEPVTADSQVSMRPITSVPPERTGSSDLVDRMVYLFARVLKVKTGQEINTSVYAKLVIGTHTVSTKTVPSPADWDQVFAFHKNDLNATTLDISVWSQKPTPPTSTNKDPQAAEPDACLGRVMFELHEVPRRVTPDSPLAPQWYTLEGSSPGNDVMLAVWLGTQADEAFQESWQSDSGGLVRETRAKAYLSPKLWYLRLTVIQAQDLQIGSGTEAKAREFYVKAQLGPQVFKTARSLVGFSSAGVAAVSATPTWNEDLVFVAAEPFEPYLVFSVEDVTAGKTVGEAKLTVAGVDRRTDDKAEPPSRWFNLLDSSKDGSYAGRIHVRVCLEGGYHVLDEAAQVASDVRAAANQLAKPAIGCLEVGIRGAANLLPMKTEDGKGTTDAYVVVKYGPKWFRTRTLVDQFNPRWNEQYTWDVYDPCTVLTVGIFDNGRHDSGEKPGKDIRMGKIRIRLSTLEINRVYLSSYPIIAIHPTGAKKMGEVELAVRFTCSSWLCLLQSYSAPLLPRMHYVRPLGPAQQDILRHSAVRLVTARLGRSEPPLGPEVVHHMLDSDSHIWSMRRSKSNWFRIIGCLSRVAALARWLDGVRNWVQPSTTLLVHLLLIAVVICPNFIVSTLFMYLFLVVMWRWRLGRRSGPPGGIDGRLSCVDSVMADELDEELDTFPSSRSPDEVRARYDRLRALAGRAQVLLGDLASQGERVEALLNWRDPRATSIFVAFCLMASLIFYVVPTRLLVLLGGFYYLRHPRFRGDMPSVPVNFFRRLPSQADRIL